MFELLSDILFGKVKILKEEETDLIVENRNKKQVKITFRSKKSKLNFIKLRKDQSNMCIDTVSLDKYKEISIIFSSIKDSSIISFCTFNYASSKIETPNMNRSEILRDMTVPDFLI